MDTACGEFNPALDNRDKYTESIDLSNKCREFYRWRMENMEKSKQRLSPTLRPGHKTKKSSIDVAMAKLGTEMTSLMDQDMSLMKQLLMLNEAIEELKFHRRYSNSSLPDSSCDLVSDSDDESVSETDMFVSEDDLVKMCNNCHLGNVLTNSVSTSCDNNINHVTTKQSNIIQSKNFLDKSSREEQNVSYDSGFESSYVSS
ncbi:uncharacterized protein LOC110448697 [Mizuhopecten yessoensis]|uniref:Uncharacterized protein n=1 Tax=Mizuhopecten yessoensis TaxID=6573 RepID=A0A210QSK0_MIZYE|nr:uncharacterized protein LOC110448697 [Mizuhopecten yessoensis]OWF51737.1 hypothetical protein KP79_PYT08234 [Mizuhopecten yessoensis]